MVEPAEKVAGSTFAWGLVTALALQVAWLNGSVPMSFVAADAVVVGPTRQTASAPAAREVRTARRREVLGLLSSREWGMAPPVLWVLSGWSPSRAMPRVSLGLL